MAFPDVSATGPLMPDGSVARKSQGVREIVAWRIVTGPANSTDDTRPTLDADIVDGTVKLTAQAPFQANAGGFGISTLSTRTEFEPMSLAR